MGIDIYLNWPGMTDEDHNLQVTGFSTVHGHVGYLREAYHGGPYATHVLLPESWDHEKILQDEDDPRYEGVEIEAKVIVPRVIPAIIAALTREAHVYGNTHARDLLMEIGLEPAAPKKDVGTIDLGSRKGQVVGVQGGTDEDVDEVLGSETVQNALHNIFENLIPESQKEQDLPETPAISPTWLKRVMDECPQAKSIAEFAFLALKKEIETGKPCRIYNSY